MQHANVQQQQQQQQGVFHQGWHHQSMHRPVIPVASCNLSPSPCLSPPMTCRANRQEYKHSEVHSLTKALAPGVHGLPFCPSLAPVAVHSSSLVVRQIRDAIPVLVPPGADTKLWIEAARSFKMNTDFDISADLRRPCRDLPSFMAVMKEESVGKQTIQALADKLMLHRLVSNLGIAQMPCLLAVEGPKANCRQEVEAFVRSHVYAPGSGEVVVKPTHLSNGDGVIVVSRPEANVPEATAQFVQQHVQRHLAQRAGDHESLALRSLRPGFLAQPIYDSVFGFEAPIELRLVTLWGKVRLAVWWWGRSADEHSQRNAWLIRRPARADRLGDDDTWEPLHEHKDAAADPGFLAGLELCREQLPHLTRSAETLATAVGAPFLRADFFVGSAHWGARLNEVAYGCGVDYRAIAQDGTGRAVDDAQAIAEILRQGLEACSQRLPASHFLSSLGASGHSYEDMVVHAAPRGVQKSMREEPRHITTTSPNQRREVFNGVMSPLVQRRGVSGGAMTPRLQQREVSGGVVVDQSSLSPLCRQEAVSRRVEGMRMSIPCVLRSC